MLNFIGFQVFGNSENAQKFVANKLCSNGFTDFICTLYLYMFNGHAFGELASVSEHIYLYFLKTFFHPQIKIPISMAIHITFSQDTFILTSFIRLIPHLKLFHFMS